MSKTNLSTVVIVGRTNVGKSTLFNRLSVDAKSITFDYEGVTRDFVKDVVTWQDRSFELIDTGGIDFKKTEDPIFEQSRQRALSLLEHADIILFVCDGKVGVIAEDREVAKLLHKLHKHVLLVVNKVDAAVAQEHLHEFQQLGFKEIFAISAQHAKGVIELLERTVAVLPKKKQFVEEPVACKVVILGKPNVGKSSLMNLLLQEERSIVADQPGTTREAISERVRFYQEEIEVTDTPGLRKKRAVHEPIESLMVQSALRTLDSADIVLLVVDASAGRISDQELKLAFYTFEERYKGLIILFNKSDLVDERIKKDLDFSLDEYKYFMKRVVSLSISCITHKNVGKILTVVDKLIKRYSQKFSDEQLTLLFKEALRRKPLFKSEQELHLYSVSQLRTAPITIALRTNQPMWFGPSQCGFFENILRKEFDLVGVPIKFIVRK